MEFKEDKMTQKKVEYFKDQKKTKETMSDCHKVVMASASEYVEPIWYDCLKEIFQYEKKPVLASQHLLFLDERLKKGLEIYNSKGIKELVKTETDIRAIIESKSEPGKTYDVVLKCWKPDKLLRYRYQILEYLENLIVTCSCKDFIMGKYKHNCSVICPHIASTLWFLMQEDSMPKFLRTKEEFEKGWYEKSKTVELDNNIKGLSMKMFENHLNILALREFKDMKTSVSLSIHRKPNKEYEDRYKDKPLKPVWISFSEPGDIERIIKALIKGMVEMLASRGNTETQIKEAINKLIPKEILEDKNGEKEDKPEALNLSVPENLITLTEPKKGWFKKIINKIKEWFK